HLAQSAHRHGWRVDRRLGRAAHPGGVDLASEYLRLQLGFLLRVPGGRADAVDAGTSLASRQPTLSTPRFESAFPLCTDPPWRHRRAGFPCSHFTPPTSLIGLRMSATDHSRLADLLARKE